MKIFILAWVLCVVTVSIIIGVNAWALVLQHMIDAGMVTIICEVQK